MSVNPRSCPRGAVCPREQLWFLRGSFCARPGHRAVPCVLTEHVLSTALSPGQSAPVCEPSLLRPPQVSVSCYPFVPSLKKRRSEVRLERVSSGSLSAAQSRGRVQWATGSVLGSGSQALGEGGRPGRESGFSAQVAPSSHVALPLTSSLRTRTSPVWACLLTRVVGCLPQHCGQRSAQLELSQRLSWPPFRVTQHRPPPPLREGWTAVPACGVAGADGGGFPASLAQFWYVVSATTAFCHVSFVLFQLNFSNS